MQSRQEDGYVVIEINDDTPLLPPTDAQAKPGWSGWFASKAKKMGGVFTFIATHPITSIAALTTSASHAANALAAPSGKSAEHLGIEWWNGMTGIEKAHSIANGSSSLAINTIMNASFFPKAWQLFKSRIKHTLDSASLFAENIFSLLLSLEGAIAAGAIGYTAFLWLPYGSLTAIIPGAMAFLTTLAPRYLSTSKAIKSIKTLFNKDAKTQREFANRLDRIHPEYLNELEANFQKILQDVTASHHHHHDKNKPLSDEEQEAVMVELAEFLTNLHAQHPNILKEQTSIEYATQYARLLFEITFAFGVIMPATFLTFMQKGYAGTNLIYQAASGGKTLDKISLDLKRLIGSGAGLASASFYSLAAFCFLDTAKDLAKHLYQHPKQIPFAMTLVAANGFASGSMQSVAQGIVESPTNITGIPNRSPHNALYVAIITGAAFMVNAKSSIEQAILPGDTPLNALTVKAFAKRTKDAVRHTIKDETGNSLRQQMTFFDRRLPNYSLSTSASAESLETFSSPSSDSDCDSPEPAFTSAPG